MIIRFSGIVAAALLMGWTPKSWAQAEEDRSASSVKQLSFFGRVWDQNQTPIGEAVISLVPAGDFTRVLASELNPSHPKIQATSDAEGKFRIEFGARDARRLSAEMLCCVDAKGFRPHLEKIPIARLLVDVPFQVDMQRGAETQVWLVDPEGRPFAGANVQPASIAGQRVPWCVAKDWKPAVSDDDGRVHIDRADADSLQGVFVIHDEGHQRLPVQVLSERECRAQTLPVRAVAGQLRQRDSQPVPGITDAKLFVTSVPSDRASTAQGSLSCGWTLARIDKDGKFQIPAMALGNLGQLLSCPADFAFRVPYSSDLTALTDGKQPFHWDLEIKKQVRLIATVVDSESSAPLENIMISSFDGRIEPTFTDKNGKAVFYRMRDHVSYYPRDLLGVHFFADAFYQDSNQLPDNGVIELEPISLNRSSAWQGRVVDQQGRPVAGAKVTYEFAQERFTNKRFAYSDSAGYFGVTGVADRTAVTIRAVKGQAVSEAKSIVLPTAESFELAVTQKRTAIPTGRLLDLQGKPVEGVPVSIKLGQVTIKESYNAEELSAVDLYDSSQVVRTDSAGVFEFPPTIEHQGRIQIQVMDPSLHPMHSSFVDGSQLADDQQLAEDPRLYLGDFRVMRRSEAREIEIAVQSSSGDPIAEADVVVVGARTGTVRGTTDSRGQLKLDWTSGQAIVAVAAVGYHLHLAEAPTDKSSWEITLESETQPVPEHESVRQLAPQQFADAAESLFESMGPIQPKTSTFHRLRLYCAALACQQPEQFLQYVNDNLVANPQLGQIALLSADQALRRQPEVVESALTLAPGVSSFLSGVLVQAADVTEDPDLREDWLGEALLAARGQSGSARTFAMASLANTFLAAGRVELAKEVTNEVWSSSDNLKRVLKKGERKKLIGESRTLGPVLALIDLDQSLRLIELTAREVELSRLKTQAVLLRAQAYPDEFQSDDPRLKELDSYGVDSWLRHSNMHPGLAVLGLPQPSKIASGIDDLRTRIQFLVYHARIAGDSAEADQLMEMTVDSLRDYQSDASADHHLFHYSGALLKELRRFEAIDERMLDRVIFAALWSLPAQFDADRLQTVLAAAAQIVSLRDWRLAKSLLEPAFSDRGWVYMGRQLSWDRNETLTSVGRIDPAWAVELVEKMCQEDMKYDPTDQMELRSGMITSLMSMVPPR